MRVFFYPAKLVECREILFTTVRQGHNHPATALSIRKDLEPGGGEKSAGCLGRGVVAADPAHHTIAVTIHNTPEINHAAHKAPAITLQLPSFIFITIQHY